MGCRGIGGEHLENPHPTQGLGAPPISTDNGLADRALLYYKVLVAQSCPTLQPQTVACQAPLSMGFSRQQYWSGLPWPSLGDLPNPRIEPRSPALQADSLLS